MVKEYKLKNKHLHENIFWAGFIINVLSALIKGKYLFSQRIGELIQIIGLIVLLYSFFIIMSVNIKNSYLKIIFILFICWSIITVSRGVHFDYTSVKALLLDNEYGVLFYLLPFIILVPPEFSFLQRLFETIIVLGIFYLIYSLIFLGPLLSRSPENQNVVEYLVRSLGITSAFILLTFKYHKTSKQVISAIVLLLCLLFTIYKARRGLSITLISLSVPILIMLIFVSKYRLLYIYLIILTGLCSALYFSGIYKIEEVKLLSFIAERGDTDTRTGVELYFYDDMEDTDWIIGKGIDGAYYSPGIGESDYRTLMETGYLQIILKGGLVRLILLLLTALPAIFLGLFNSRNVLSKASAIWIGVALISLYPATVESFSLQYVLVWVSIGICYSKNIRDLSDDYIQNELNLNSFHFKKFRKSEKNRI